MSKKISVNKGKEYILMQESHINVSCWPNSMGLKRIHKFMFYKYSKHCDKQFFHTEWSNMPPTVSWFTGKAVQCSLVKYLDLITAEYLMNETYG